jgi:hypothetical protein
MASPRDSALSLYAPVHVTIITLFKDLLPNDFKGRPWGSCLKEGTPEGFDSMDIKTY